MNTIILDLEWNQPGSALHMLQTPFPFSSEIIEIGAVKLDDDFHVTDCFKQFIRPKFYQRLNGLISRLTNIRSVNLQEAPFFPQAYRSFLQWCGDEFRFCTWGPDDMPVLLDNLLMHKMDTDRFPLCFDLQHVFAMEVLKENRQMGLEKAMELLELTPEKAHDALNDAKNTVEICQKAKLHRFMDQYATGYTAYGDGRLKGLLSGRLFPTLESAQKDVGFACFRCPVCGGTVRLSGWKKKSATRMLGLGKCACGARYLASCRHGKPYPGKSVKVTRTVLAMNKELEETYRSC